MIAAEERETSMELREAIAARRSVRDFDPSAPVSDEQVRDLLEAAIRAPSAGNCQAWAFWVVRDPALRQALCVAAHGQPFVARAPVVIVVCADQQRNAGRYGTRGTTLYCLQDTAAAIEHLLLAAVAAGLGTCWVGAFDEAAATAALELPVHLRPVALIPLGKPADQPLERSSRRPLEEVTTWR